MNENILNECLEIIRSNKSDEEVKVELLKYHENDIAKIFPILTLEERQRIYCIIEPDILADIFSYLDDPESYFDEMPDEKVTDIFETMDTDDIVDVLEDLEDDKRNELIELMDKDSVEEIKMIESYDDDMIGSKMTTNFIAVDKDSSVKQAMKKVVEEAAENDNVSIIYFTTNNDEFYGAIDLRDLIIAREHDVLDDLIKTSYPHLLATDIVSDVLNKIQDYALESIPVVDHNNHLIGVITSDDVIEAVQEEMGDDYAKLGGLSSEEDLEESTVKSIKKRIPWLLILMGLGLVTSLLISRFEYVVAALPLLVFFQSLILDMAGNTGTQSLAVTIRSISSDELTRKEIIKLVLKELRIGFFNGLILGVLSCGVVFLFLLIRSEEIVTGIKIAIVVGISMIGSMTIASLAGSLIPIIFKKCKIDPAVASGPFITTLNDVIAICIYYGLAWVLLLAI